jgi:hypothetical protein
MRIIGRFAEIDRLWQSSSAQPYMEQRKWPHLLRYANRHFRQSARINRLHANTICQTEERLHLDPPNPLARTRIKGATWLETPARGIFIA